MSRDKVVLIISVILLPLQILSVVLDPSSIDTPLEMTFRCGTIVLLALSLVLYIVNRKRKKD